MRYRGNARKRATEQRENDDMTEREAWGARERASRRERGREKERESKSECARAIKREVEQERD